MRGKYFLDTNILIYSFDSSAPQKQKKAHALIHQALSSGRGSISYQVVQEFLNVATRKFATPLSLQEAKTYLDRVLMPLCHIFPQKKLWESALEIHTCFSYSFYDSLIIAGAVAAQCSTLISEDLQAGQTILGVEMSNPFLIV